MSEVAIKTRKKLIEVALPLDAINIASAREKSIRHGHPSTLHLWWARRPLAAARAVIFSQMVDDPSEYTDTLLQVDETRKAAERELKKRRKLWEALPDDADREAEPTLEGCAADIERERLFRIIEDLVKWENTTNEFVLDKARAEIWQSWRRACADNAGHPRASELFDRTKLPAFHDPFAGGGALPLEAQRLGLDAHASDLNPVAVLINKAMIEIPPKFAGQRPVNPDADPNRKWKGAEGLADDVRYFGKWMRDEAEKRIGRFYPKFLVTAEMAADRPDLKPYIGQELTVSAWLWARTVNSPNPAFRDIEVPLASTFLLSAKPGSEAWVEPVIEGNSYYFRVQTGKPANLTSVKAGTMTRSGGTCVISGTPIPFDLIRAEGKAGRIGDRLMAIYLEAGKHRILVSPTAEQEEAAAASNPEEGPAGDIPEKALGVRVPLYGINEYHRLFSRRQKLAMQTFVGLIKELNEEISRHDASAEYVAAIRTYLAMALGRYADYGSAMTYWDNRGPSIQKTYGLPTLQMRWGFPETNPLGEFSGNFSGMIEGVANVILSSLASRPGWVEQHDAVTVKEPVYPVISTDPPYYDNIGYAALSDYFYIWLKASLRDIYPSLLSTIVTPKNEELIAEPGRHGNRKAAMSFFEDRFRLFAKSMLGRVHPSLPVTIFYAFKQAETDSAEGVASTGWEVFLTGLVREGWEISGTWPMRTEQTGGLRLVGRNSLASSIVLVCHPRPAGAPTATRREFLNALKSELPRALHHLQRGNIAPVDLAQAAIGPGMAVFTRFAQVLDAEGKELGVREALARINEVLDETLAAQEGDFDPDTRWAVTWFDQFGFEEGDYGHAEQLSKAKNTAVAELADVRNGGIVTSRGGKVKLTRPADLPEDWDPDEDPRLTVWEMVHHLIARMDNDGEAGAAELVAQLGVRAETARELAYRLYAIAERKKRSADGQPYNALVQSWPELVRLARDITASGATGPAQAELAI